MYTRERERERERERGRERESGGNTKLVMYTSDNKMTTTT